MTLNDYIEDYLGDITCNWCTKNISKECKYVYYEDIGLPLSCCDRCFNKFCKINGLPRKDEHNKYYYWENVDN